MGNAAAPQEAAVNIRTSDNRINWIGSWAFLLFHLIPLGALLTGVHWSAWIVMGGLFLVRRWFITAGYHRYFSHRSYKMGRAMQFLMALGGSTAVQQGPLWWAAMHRHHHKYSDQPQDAHSPRRGFFWSHIGWILSRKYDRTMLELVPDLAKYPELRWLDKYYLVPQAALALLVLGLGLLITRSVVGAFGFTFIGFFLSTVILSHATFTINSLSHLFGKRRYATSDTSRNNWVLALLTGGEGWHNNHHHYQRATRQGFRWYEYDSTFYVLWAMSKVGLVKGLHKPPERVLNSHLLTQGAVDLGMFHRHWERAMQALQRAGAATDELAVERRRKLEELAALIKSRLEQIAGPANQAPGPLVGA